MNARERILDMIENSDQSHLTNTVYHKDAAALRELDQLCEELTQWAKSYIKLFTGDHLEHHPIKALVDRASQAGYGEK